MSKQKFLVSTDISGIMGKPQNWEYIWADVLNDKNFSGFEMIGWNWSGGYIGPHNKHRIVGIHGRTAGWSEGRELMGKVMLSSLNHLFLDFESLVKNGKNTEYILLHRGTLNKEIQAFVIQHKDNIKQLLVENDLIPNSLPKTIQLIEYLRENGVYTGMMFDVVHFLREPHLDSPDIKRFDKLIDALDSLKGVSFPINCHFPIGEYANDSLPLDLMTEDMWKRLSKAVSTVPFKYIVLENQAPRRYSLYLSRKDMIYFRKRTHLVYELLKKYKII